MNNNMNKLVTPEVESNLEQMKMEIAKELNISFGADATAKENGKIGGEMTKRLIAIARSNLLQ